MFKLFLFQHSIIHRLKKMPTFIFLIQFRTIIRTPRRGVKFKHLLSVLTLIVVCSMYEWLTVPTQATLLISAHAHLKQAGDFEVKHNTVRTASHKVKLMFILCFDSNRNVFYLYTVTSVACSSAPCYAHAWLLYGFIGNLQYTCGHI